MKSNQALIIGAILCSTGASLRAQTFTIESDIQPYVEDMRILTDAIDDDTGDVIPNVHFFGYRFLEDPLDPYFVADPGFDAEDGSGLPPFSSLRFDAVRHLAYWNGAGDVSFTTPPNSEALRLSLGAASVTISGASAAQAGFTIGNVSSTGALHRHLSAFMLGADGNADPNDGVVATGGVYFTNMRLSSSDPSILPSDSLYLVYDNGAGNSAFEAALAYLANPLPGDANFDGAVNLRDFNILATNFGTSDQFWYAGDFNRDRVVNLQDFNILASHFGESISNQTAIPDPSAGAALAPLALLLRRRGPLQRAGSQPF